MDIPYTVEPRPDTGLFNAKVGIWLFLASEVMLFGALFSSYILLRVGAAPGAWPHGLLNVWLGMTNTIVLIVSSITVVMAWASLKMKDFGKFKMYQTVTLLCAVAFLCIKSYEYHDKFIHYEVDINPGAVVHFEDGKDVTIKAGDSVDGHLIERSADKVVIHGHIVNQAEASAVTHAWQESEIKEQEITIKQADVKFMENYGPWHNTYTAIYFTLTGLHALHVIGGALVIGFIWGPGAGMWKTDPERYTNRVEVSGLFWHFVDLVWIFLFPVLYLL
ncbi:MAG TPA: cytochrome c oxidase subunit 3 [Verrucomicrobiae bacterium]|jgi:cytochrome c oxidase subunit 3|nr:cytochrome c oxidase subunit 3 [Verrucomicrobiae bacterium]